MTGRSIISGDMNFAVPLKCRFLLMLFGLCRGVDISLAVAYLKRAMAVAGTGV